MNNNELIISYLAEMRNKIDSLFNEVIYLKQCILASECHRNLRKFKNCMEGKDVAIIATGPSAKYYIPQKKCINIGINGAIYLSNVELDYIFVQDFTAGQKNNEKLNRDIYCFNNSKKNLIKFWGIHHTQPLRSAENKNVFPIPHYYIEDNKYNFTYILSKHNFEMSHYIDIEPFEDMGSTTLSALQFVLYCNPKNIFLVGCDCTSGYATKEGYTKSDNHYQRDIWVNYVKPFLHKYYPKTKITSINPVGLKGVFFDQFQDQFPRSNVLQNICPNNDVAYNTILSDNSAYYKLIYNLFRHNEKCVNIYCAGLICDKLLNFLNGTDIKINYIFDRKAKFQNIFLNKHKVVDFDSIYINSLKQEYTFVVASFSFIDEIRQNILSKFENSSIKPKIYTMVD